MKVRIGPYRKNRAEQIEIESFDTWNMDQTLAKVIAPMLKQLKETKHGAPFVHTGDVPKELRPSVQEVVQWEKDGTTDDKFFKRWDWVLDQMIYSFEYSADDERDILLDIKDNDEREKEQDRIDNGFMLFGKYYQNLWD